MIFSLSGEKLGELAQFFIGEGDPCMRNRFSYMAMASRLLPSSQKLSLRGLLCTGFWGD